MPHDNIGLQKYSQVESHVEAKKSRSTQLSRKTIDLSQLCYDSTCVILKITLSLACLTCQTKLRIYTKKCRHQKALERHKNKRNQCDQLWLTKWVASNNSATSKMIKYNEVRTYLEVESNVYLDFKDALAKK